MQGRSKGRLENSERSCSPTTDSSTSDDFSSGRAFSSVGYRRDVMYGGPGAGFPLHDRNSGDDLFADSNWFSSSSSVRATRSRYSLAQAKRWLWGSGRRACAKSAGLNTDLFDRDEPLLGMHERSSWCMGRGEDGGEGEHALRGPTFKAIAAHSLLALVIVLVIVCLFGNQFIQLSVYSSSLSFVAVNITLPLPPAHRSWHIQRRHSEKSLIKNKHADSGRSEDWERAIIGFDSQMRISAGALWLWPWTMRMGGANYTLEFSLQPGIGGDGGGDGRFVPCTVGTLSLPSISLRGGQGTLEVPIKGFLHVSPQTECFRGFTRGMLLADHIWISFRGAADLGLEVSAGTVSWSIGFPAIKISKSLCLQAISSFRAPSSDGDKAQLIGVEATEIRLDSSTSSSIIARIRLKIPNPSVFQVTPLGAMKLKVQYQHACIGVFEVVEWDTVGRGTNVVLVQGKLDVAQADLSIASDLFSAVVGGRKVMLSASVYSSTNAILADGLAAVSINTSIAAPPFPLLASDSIQILSCSIVPVADKGERHLIRPRPHGQTPPDMLFPHALTSSREGLLSEGHSAVWLSVRVEVAFNSPLGSESALKLSSLSASQVLVRYANTTIALFEVPAQQLVDDQDSVIQVSTDTIAFVDDDAFGQFVSDWMTKREMNISLAATLSVNVTTVMGDLCLQYIPIEQYLVLPGAGGFADVEVVGFDVSGAGSTGILQVQVKATVSNPTSMSATLGAVSFDLMYEGCRLGEVSTPNLVVVPGEVEMQVSGVIMPTESVCVAALGQLVARYLRGELVYASVRGISASTYPAAWLSRAISSFHLSVPLQMPSPLPLLLQDISFDNLGIHFSDAATGGAGRYDVKDVFQNRTQAHTRPDPSLRDKKTRGDLNGMALLDVTIRATLALPFSVHMDVRSADLKLFISGGPAHYWDRGRDTGTATDRASGRGGDTRSGRASASGADTRSGRGVETAADTPSGRGGETASPRRGGETASPSGRGGETASPPPSRRGETPSPPSSPPTEQPAFAYLELLNADIHCDLPRSLSNDMSEGLRSDRSEESETVRSHGSESLELTHSCQVTLKNVPLRVVDEVALESFLRVLFHDPLVMLTFEGNASVTLAMPFGDLYVADVPLSSSTVMHGMAALDVLPIQVSDIAVYEATAAEALAEELPVSLSVSIFNPSDLEVALGDMTMFSISLTDCTPSKPLAKGARVLGNLGAQRQRQRQTSLSQVSPFASVSLRSAVLKRGWNHLVANGTYSGGLSSCGEEFLSRFINGQETNVTLRGLKSHVPLIQSFLDLFETRVVTPGLPPHALVAEAHVLMSDPLPVIESGVLHVTVTLTNPMLATAELLSLSLALLVRDSSGQLQVVGDYIQDLEAGAHEIVLLPHSTLTTPPLCVRLRKVVSPLVIKAFLEATSSTNGAPVWLKGPVKVRLGGKVEAHLNLQQGPAPAKLHFVSPPACWPQNPGSAATGASARVGGGWGIASGGQANVYGIANRQERERQRQRLLEPDATSSHLTLRGEPSMSGDAVEKEEQEEEEEEQEEEEHDASGHLAGRMRDKEQTPQMPSPLEDAGQSAVKEAERQTAQEKSEQRQPREQRQKRSEQRHKWEQASEKREQAQASEATEASAQEKRTRARQPSAQEKKNQGQPSATEEGEKTEVAAVDASVLVGQDA